MQNGAGYLLAAVWLANGVGAKLLGLIPRHRLIVARFFGESNSYFVTASIGVAETAMAVWILSGRWRGACAIAQAIVVATMNSLELWRAPDLLLFPRLMPVANAGLLAVAWWWSRAG